MIKRSNVILLLSCFGYLFLYIFIFKNFVLFDRAFCFIYLAFLLSIPIDTHRVLAMFIGFFTGLVIDVFSDSLGIHTAACVLLMHIRYYVIESLTPQGGYNSGTPSTASMGLSWYLTYAAPLILVHQLFLFYLEAGGTNMFFFTLTKALLSTILTLLVIILFQYLFGKTSERSL